MATQVFDPSGKFIVQWNSLMFIIGLINFYLDPIFLYLPSNKSTAFIYMDLQLGARLAALRMIGDFVRFLDIIVRFRTAYEDPSSKVFNRRRLVQEPRAIAIKYLRSTFVIDILAVLPLPQVCSLHLVYGFSSSI